jgi:DNA-binding beta-propeller fold protein YncE
MVRRSEAKNHTGRVEYHERSSGWVFEYSPRMTSGMRAIIAACAILAAAGFGVLGHLPARAAAAGCRAGVVRYNVALPGHPFRAVPSADGRHAFVSVSSSNPRSPNGIAVLRCESGMYRFSHLVPLEAQPSGMAITHDGKLLVVADDGFVAFVDTAAAIAGKSAIAGYVQDLEGDPEDNDPGSVYVNVSPDDRFAYVSDEQNDTISVIDLAKARRNGFSRSSIVGAIPVGNAPIALSFSHDARYLFTTSEIAPRAYGWPKSCRQEGAPASSELSIPAGAIVTIDTVKAQTNPASSVVAKVPADCSPVRMSLSPDGSTAWVTNRGSNTLTGFSTKGLIAGASDARLATIEVGSNPVAVWATGDGKYVLVGNTNRFGTGGTTSGTVSIVEVAKKSVVATIAAGEFPREFSPGFGTTLFLSNYRSNSLTVFDESRLDGLVTASGR